MKRVSRSTLKIISAVSVSVFSLLALSVGVYAWFVSKFSVSEAVDTFDVTTVGDCSLADIKLIKFEYPESEVFEGLDYLKPENGAVNKYDYSEEEEHFGYLDEHDEWVSVSQMNLYDPIELVISRDISLKDLNCNAIYQISITSSSYDNALMKVTSYLKDGITLGTNEILLSDCADFDVFTNDDLSDTNPLFYDSTSGQYNKYYPSYKNTLSDTEKVYYKISYLSSLVVENAHSHFYGTNPKATPITLANENINFAGGTTFTIYINANYAPKQLEKYAKTLYLSNIFAHYDFGFEISLEGVNS